jgi:hypothetical protein
VRERSQKKSADGKRPRPAIAHSVTKIPVFSHFQNIRLRDFPDGGRRKLTSISADGGKTGRMNFSELTLPQKVAAQELALRALQDEVKELRALIVSLVDVVATPMTSPEHKTSLATLLAIRNRMRGSAS